MSRATPEKKLVFRTDWFSEHAPSWDRIISPRLKGRDGARALVVGAYEGRAVEWLVKAMTGARPSLTIVDAFRAGGESCVNDSGKGVWNPSDQVRKTLEDNLAVLRASRPDAKIDLVPEASTEIGLLRLRAAAAPLTKASKASVRPSKASKQPEAYDVIYVDCQSSQHALECAVLAFPLLRRGGGVMVLTNYTHGRLHDSACPRRGIDGFLDAYVAELRVLRSAFHLFLERRAEPLPMPVPCHHEAYDTGASVAKPICRPSAAKAALREDTKTSPSPRK